MDLFQKIRSLVSAERYVVGQHASERLEERGFLEWQAVAGLDEGQCLRVDERSVPNPTVVVVEELPDGTEFHAVWSYLASIDVAKLVTVYFPE